VVRSTIRTRSRLDVIIHDQQDGSSMRTTLTLDPDVAQLVREAIEHEHVSLKHVINEGLRKGLKHVAPRRSLRIVPHQSLLRPAFNPRGFNQLADEFENEAVISALKKSR
jgi:hypothetical protein